MSYILDALKKSEQERQQLNPQSGATNGLINPEWQQTTSTSTPSSTLLPGLILGALMALLVAAGVWVFQDDEVALQTPVAEPVSLKSVQSKLVQLEPIQSEQQKEAVVATTDLSSQVEPVLAKAVPVKTTSIKTEPVKTVTNTEVKAEGEPVSAVQAAPAQVTPASSPNVTRSQRTLPPLSVLRTVPDLIITGHIYSSMPDKRSVSMNGHEWSEGDYVNGNLFIKEITPDGIIVDVDGWSLPLKRNKGWQAIQ
ncbi:general secretion pathway protein GspB [Bacterioplanoides sp.]|uniref:general secretion pathway protein GspB n=1 Tax=Bacterioplanoides sp. TaxID=2066072 RepID=UPI003B00BAA1